LAWRVSDQADGQRVPGAGDMVGLVPNAPGLAFSGIAVDSGSFQRCTVPMAEVGRGFIRAEQVTHQLVIR
jgi:hypothetical protein